MLSTRRDFHRLMLSGLAATAVSAEMTSISGVKIGIGSYTLRTLKLDEMLAVVAATKVGGIELEALFVEPQPPAGTGRGGNPEFRESLRKWRLSEDGMAAATAVRKKLDAAGVEAYVYNLDINDTFTDEEIERSLTMAKVMGASIFNTITTLSMAKRIAPIAEKLKLRIGLHPGGQASNPDSFGSGESYLRAFDISPGLNANLDLSLFKNWGPDPIAFIRANHARITTIHFHDRKLSEPSQPFVPFGEGDTPARELLLLAKLEKYSLVFSIERLYTVPDLDQLTELRRSIEFCRKVLA